MEGKIKKIVLSTTGYLSTDQRVHKVAMSLLKFGFMPSVAGRELNTVLKSNLSPPYKQIRISTLVKKGPFFYAEFNARLFFLLLFKKADILVSNDLDTLPANYLVYLIKRIFNRNLKLVYDSHELFTELPELNNRFFPKKTWLLLEKAILPHLKNAYTVCDSIAGYYFKMYGIEMKVVKNYPLREKPDDKDFIYRTLWPVNKKIILYQGALNIGRGIDFLVPLMKNIENAVFVIIGTGSIELQIREMIEKLNLGPKVILMGRIDFRYLYNLTQKADVGIVLQEDLSLSYRYVLPNRLFDFIKAEVPVLASSLPEIKKIVEAEKIGVLVDNMEPEHLLNVIRLLLDNKDEIKRMKENLSACKEKYYWENQENLLFSVYSDLKS
ncbi:MAG: glycosyltransferase [Bacteroidales bacterium]